MTLFRTPSVMTLFRPRRDFGITAAVIIAISAVAVSATFAGIAMTTTVQTATTLNNLSATVAQALDTQTSLNAQLRGGLMVLNQRIDLVQEQVDLLWQLAQWGCECITSVQLQNGTKAANLSKQLSSCLTGNWSGNFEKTLERLWMAVVTINSTRVDLSMAEGLTSWIQLAASHLKEWAGLGALLGLMILALVACLWCICKIRFAQHRHAAMIIQAFMAIEAGQSSQAWLINLQP